MDLFYIFCSFFIILEISIWVSPFYRWQYWGKRDQLTFLKQTLPVKWKIWDPDKSNSRSLALNYCTTLPPSRLSHTVKFLVVWMRFKRNHRNIWYTFIHSTLRKALHWNQALLPFRKRTLIKKYSILFLTYSYLYSCTIIFKRLKSVKDHFTKVFYLFLRENV